MCQVSYIFTPFGFKREGFTFKYQHKIKSQDFKKGPTDKFEFCSGSGLHL